MSKKYNAKNERIKRDYFDYLAEAGGRHKSTIAAASRALQKFEAHTKFADFASFNKRQAKSFKESLLKTPNVRTSKPLAASSVHSTLRQIMKFLQWLSGEQGYRRFIKIRDVEYLNPSRKTLGEARARPKKQIPTFEQIRQCINSMPSNTDIELRNRALIAFVALTGIRVTAAAKLPLGLVDIEDRFVDQDPRATETKASKHIKTFFFPVGDDFERIFTDYVKHLRENLQYGDEAPLFPSTRMKLNTIMQFEPDGLVPEFWSDASPIRKIFQESFTAANLPYFNPHSFRNCLINYGQQHCDSVEAFKAWSQNIGHNKVLTSLDSYGHVPLQRQGELVRNVGERNNSDDRFALIEEVKDQFLEFIESKKKNA